MFIYSSKLGNSSKNMGGLWKKVLKLWEDYILDIYIGLYKGTLEERMELR